MTVEEAQLVVVEGPRPGRRHTLRGSDVLGRGEDVTIFVDDPEISRRHARIERSDDGFVIEDLCSRNGTMVAGRRIAVPTLLCYGDAIRLGNHVELLFTARRRRRDEPIRQRRRETLGRLSASAAHDLGNKLCAALASLDYLRSLPPVTSVDAPEARDCIADLAASLDESLDLLPLLRDLAQPPQRDAVADVSRILADLSAYFAHSFGADRAVSRVENDLTVKGDSAELYQVFLELAGHAREAMPEGGRLFFGARKRPLSQFDRRRGHVIVAIRGRASTEDDTFRAPQKEPPWLAPIEEVIAGYGGRLRVSDADGWAFHIELALHEVVRPKTTSDVLPCLAMPTVRRGPVLIVHDDRVVRSAVSRVLGGAGIDVVEAVALEALGALEGIRAEGRIRVAVVEDAVAPEGGSLVDVMSARGLRLVVMKGRAPASRPASTRHLLPEPWTAETVLAAVERFLDED